MKIVKHFFLIVIICCIYFENKGYGQASQNIKLSELKAPSSPAFSILGVQPNDISRPKDFNSLELSLLNAISDNNTLSLPTNFALEATPFWLKNHDITFDKLESNRDLFSTLWQTLSISLATSQRKNFIDSTQKVNQVGFGFRSFLSKGRLTHVSNISNAVKRLGNTSNSILNFAEIIKLSKQYIDHNPNVIQNLSPTDYRQLLLDLLQFPFVKIKSVTPTSSEDQKRDAIRASKLFDAINVSRDIRREFETIYLDVAVAYVNKSIIIDKTDAEETLDNLIIEIQNNYNKNKEFIAKLDEIRDYREKRVGWLLEIAGATALESPKPSIQDIGIGRSGLWITLTNRPERILGFEWILLVRFLNEKSEAKRTKNYDGGTKIVYDNGKIILSGEILVRTEELIIRSDFINRSLIKESVTNTYLRWGFNIGYRINQNIVVQASIAKSLSSDLIYRGGFVSLLGVNFGFGQPVLIPNTTH